MADRKISVGESSKEWLMTRSTVRTVRMVDWEWKYWRVGSIVGGSKADWGCGWWIVEVYIGLLGHVRWGSLIVVWSSVWSF